MRIVVEAIIGSHLPVYPYVAAVRSKINIEQVLPVRGFFPEFGADINILEAVVVYIYDSHSAAPLAFGIYLCLLSYVGESEISVIKI